MTEPWVSGETEGKERDFRGILAMHVNICKGIAKRWDSPPYLYADLYAGPGRLAYRGREFDGSPLVARDILSRSGMPYHAIHFERDRAVAARLADALWVPTSLVDSADADNSPINVEPCQQGFANWLDKAGPQPNRFGLVYSDPIRDPIPHALLDKAAKYLPRVDILSYVSATQYKRRRGQNPDRPLLSDHIGAVGKRVVLIREPAGAWQWTFVLWSNWVKLPEWERRGFHRLDSERGARILDRLNLSDRERREATEDQLPIGDGPPYRTYAEYLKHPRFLRVRSRVFARAAGSCERCGCRPPTEPHHLRYPPWGEFDAPENLIAICHQCHCEIHGKAA